MAYIGKSPDGTGVRSRFYYTQTSGGGTSVSGSSDDGTSLAFSDGAYVDVFLNGVLLVAGTDYNTSTANTIAGLAALANGDVVEVVVYDIFTVADTVSSLNGGTFAGNVNFSGNIDVDGTTTVDGLTSSEALDVTTSTHANASVFKSTGNTQLFLQDTDASANDQFWGLQVSGGEFNILTCNDDRASGFLTPINIDSSGNPTIGPATTTFRTTPGAGANGADIRADDSGGGRIRLSRSGTDGATMISFINTNGEVGGIDTSGTSTAYNTSSDARLKENVADMTGAIDRVKTLAPKRFNFIADADTTVDGFLAHEAQTVVPEAVTGTHNEVDEDGNPVMQGIDQSKLVPLLTGALKEAIAKIETLETKVAALEAGE